MARQFVFKVPSDMPVGSDNRSEMDVKEGDPNSNRLSDMDVSERNSKKLSDMDVSEGNSRKLSDMDVSEGNSKKLSDMDVSEGNSKKLSDMDVSEGNSKKLSDMDVSERNSQKLSDMDVSERNSQKLSDMDLSDKNSQKLSDMDLSDKISPKLSDMDLSDKDKNSPKLSDMDACDLEQLCEGCEADRYSPLKLTERDIYRGELGFRFRCQDDDDESRERGLVDILSQLEPSEEEVIAQMERSLANIPSPREQQNIDDMSSQMESLNLAPKRPRGPVNPRKTRCGSKTVIKQTRKYCSKYAFKKVKFELLEEFDDEFGWLYD